MKKKMIIATAALLACFSLAGCVVVPEGGHHDCPWVEGHYGPYGGWHPGHCA